jgi:hypothetical protein
MLDVVYFVLAAVPLVSGLFFVLLAFRERMQTSAAPGALPREPGGHR